MAGTNRVRAAKRLYDLEIDEISVVDRMANQHATVAIAKRAEDEEMPEIYDAEGYPVDENELEHGDVVYDESGAEYVFVDEDAAGDLEQFADDGDYDEQGAYEEEGELVGKSAASAFRDLRRVPAAFARGRAANSAVRSRRELRAARSGRKARRAVSSAASTVRALPGAASEYGRTNLQPRGAQLIERGRNARAYSGTPQFRGQARLVGAGAGVGGVVGGLGVGATEAHRNRVGKSLGDSVLEELSKALTQADHDQVISKAMDLVEVYKAQTDEAYDLAYSLAEERELEQFEELAKSYELPVDARALGEVLYNVTKSLPPGQVQLLDRLLTSVGDRLYDEVGTSGSGQTSSIMGEIEAIASQAIGKNDGLTTEQAIVGLFEQNPDAYDEYISEQRFR